MSMVILISAYLQDDLLTLTSYQIIAKRKNEIVWDSGKVASSSMTHIAYAGSPLHSREKITWTVILWDENGQGDEPAFSWFELGLLHPADWTAKWISGNYKPNKKQRSPVDCFRKQFSANKEILSARLYATARGVYDVTINGQRLDTIIQTFAHMDIKNRISL